MRRAILSGLVGLSLAGSAQAQPQARNVVLFIADGLRDGMVNAATAPTMDRLMRAGVRFTNTHSLFPT
ncbi:alkaline phosphatase family protein, partial [Xanthomonas sontii]|uniref:alkaline phosphatase family protein n=1 Tax=Xanthomonas sontii TaxID=2650745 RepID=UPI0027EECF9E